MRKYEVDDTSRNNDIFLDRESYAKIFLGNLNRDSGVRGYPRDFYRVQHDHENGTNIRNDYYIISDMYIWNNHGIGNVHERRSLLGGKTYSKILFTQQ